MILVRVVSYRDTELMRTIASAWESADDPSRVRFAVVNQVGPETAAQLDPLSGERRVHSLQVPWHNARGLGWARRMTDRMWRGEQYTLQIDSHTRFGAGWDTALVSEWESLQDPLAVLSCYPGAFSFADESSVLLHPVPPHLIHPTGASGAGMPRQDVGAMVPGGSRGVLVSGGFQFSAGELCQRLEQVSEVMVGDERVRALQLFTHGWNVYVPWTVPLFHLYERDKPAGGHSFVDDFRSGPETANTLDRLLRRSSRAVSEFLGGSAAGLGDVRTVSDFERALAEQPGT